MKQTRAATLLAVIQVGLFSMACGQSPRPTQPDGIPVGLAIEGSDALRTAATTTYRAKVSLSNGSIVDGTATWTSSDPGVATVLASGSVVGYRSGSARLDASLQGLRASKTIVVVEDVFGLWIVTASSHQCEASGLPLSSWWPACGRRSVGFRTTLSLANDSVDPRRIIGRFSLGGVAAYAYGHCEPWHYGPEIPLTGDISSDRHFGVSGEMVVPVGDIGYASFPAGTRLTLRGDTDFVAQGEWRGRWTLEALAPTGRTHWGLEVSSNATARHECG